MFCVDMPCVGAKKGGGNKRDVTSWRLEKYNQKLFEGKLAKRIFCGNENNSLNLIKNNLSPEEEGLFLEIMSR